ncbi:hypothetical protein EGW08_006745 [Elysia chlorotica]|uniref:Calpain catalytic domain-containing protein n=1 Tax=Elysia chlorotica TaxID=188477 RepID=A0A433TVA4_ELYCH|nr:hypothetical protein EGW08_006745 [Elysia chlorotica]
MAHGVASVVEIANGCVVSVTPAQWECQRCTLLNSDHLHRCQVCESPRKMRLPTLSDVETDLTHAARRPKMSNLPSTVTTQAHSHQNSNCNNNNSLSETSLANSTAPPALDIADLQIVKQEETEEWQCLSCTFSCNPSFAKTCETCGIEKPSTLRVADLEQESHKRDSNVPNSTEMSARNSWNCPKCTFANSDTSVECGMCGQVRSVSASETWSCSHCTLENLPSDLICSACQRPKTNTSNSHGSSSAFTHPSSSTSSFMATLSKRPSHCNGFQERQNHLHESSLVEDIRKIEEKEACELRMAIIEHCKTYGDLFVDDQFPPAPKSLFQDPKVPFCEHQIWWRRPHQIISRTEMNLPWVVCRTPLPEDISQGTLGNCWFLSALAVLAEKRHLVEHLVLTDSISKEGVYQVRLCKDGLWKTVIIDDLLPCYFNGELIFSKARRKQLWVPLIEKAMAKLHGSYESLVAGKCIEGLSTLTGAPCESISLQGDGTRGEETCPDVIWAKLLSCRDLKFLMGASCGGGTMRANNEEFNQMGLRARHAYSILDVQDLEGNKLIQLRNPWGRFSWNGKWSDNSPAWQKVSKEGRNRLIARGVEHGVFWMEFSDLVRYFDSIDICKIRPDWHESRVTGLFPCHGLQPAQAVKLKVLETTDVDLCLFQQGSRGESATKHPVDLCLVVLQETKHPQQTSVGRLVTHSPRQLHGCVGCNHIFSPGEYLLVPFAFGHWNSELGELIYFRVTKFTDTKQPSYVVSVHSAKQVTVRDSLCDRQYLLADTLIQLAVTKGSREQLRPGVMAYTLMSGWAGSIFVVENVLPGQAVHVRCDCSQSSNVVSTRGTLETRDVVPSYHRQVIMILSHMERSQPYHVSRRLIHRTVRSYQPLMDWAPDQLRQAFHFPEISPHTGPLHAPRLVVD